MTVPTFTLTDPNFFTQYIDYYKPPAPPTLTTVNGAQPSDNNALKQTAFNEAISQDMGVVNEQEFVKFYSAVNIWWQGDRTAAMPHLPAYKTIDVGKFNAWYSLYISALGNAPAHDFMVDAPLPTAPIIQASVPLPPPPPPDLNPIGASVGGGYYYSTAFGKLLPVGQKWPFPASPTGALYHWVNTIVASFDFWYVVPPPGSAA
jgi:hypothetical protein